MRDAAGGEGAIVLYEDEATPAMIRRGCVVKIVMGKKYYISQLPSQLANSS